jgi:hypothetical protein
MPDFNKQSKFQLFGCVKELQDLCNEAIKKYNFAVICGHRGEAGQEKAFAEHTTKVHYPNSKHNSDPSKAVDIVPFYVDVPHIRWGTEAEYEETKKLYGDLIPWDTFKKYENACLIEFDVMIKHIKECAERLGINIICGIDYPKLYNTTFIDRPHVEIKE